MRDRSRLFPNDRAKLNMSHLANIHCMYSTDNTDRHAVLTFFRQRYHADSNKERVSGWVQAIG